ncbi:MAG: hypothetical protein DRR04_11635 [Gammaproteobacteria bacterium]|nr:MAG: hypothetical protein DRR04_11635 [Gammaproteobacteria bacterium]
MPEYDFQDERGRLITRVFRIGKAPRSVRHEGRRYERAYTMASIPSVGHVSDNIHFVCHSQEPWSEGFERYDEHGRGLVDGRREKDRFIDTQNRAADKGKAHHKGIRWTEKDD